MEQLKKIVQRFRNPGTITIMLTCTRWYLSYRYLEEIRKNAE